MISVLDFVWPVLLVCGAYGFIRAFRVRRDAIQAVSWPTTEGKIEHSAVHKGKTGSSMNSSGNTTYTSTYEARIIYSYKLEQRRFQGSRLQFGSRRRFYKRSEAEERVKTYPVGRVVTVHYNPSKPSESTLLIGVAPFWRTTVHFSAALLIVAVIVALAAN
jgi:Protein of unknown function (DUF3592).